MKQELINDSTGARPSVSSDYGPIPVPEDDSNKKTTWRSRVLLPEIRAVRKTPGELQEGVEGIGTPSLAGSHLHTLLRNQLRTNLTLDEAAGRTGLAIDFTPAAVMTNFASYSRGAQSLEKFQAMEARHRRVQELRQCGLSDSQISFKLKHDSEEEIFRVKRPQENMEEWTISKKVKGYGAHPSIHQPTLEEIRSVVNSHKIELDKDITYRGAIKLSRHAMEIENSLKTGKLNNNLLAHLVVREPLRQTGSKYVSNVKTERTSKDNESDPVWQGPLKILSRDEVIRQRISVEAIKAIPRFTKYSPGTPSKTLYIRNLSRKVDVGMLRSVFGRFEKVGPVDIKVLTKGRLKGNAFLTFIDTNTATQALIETNGYILEGKPIVVEYGTTNEKH